MRNYAKTLHNIFKQHMFWLLELPQRGNSNKYPKHMFYETRSFLHIILSIKDSLEQQIHYNGNIFGNKCCQCNEGSLYCAKINEDV